MLLLSILNLLVIHLQRLCLLLEFFDAVELFSLAFLKLRDLLLEFLDQGLGFVDLLLLLANFLVLLCIFCELLLETCGLVLCVPGLILILLLLLGVPEVYLICILQVRPELPDLGLVAVCSDFEVGLFLDNFGPEPLYRLLQLVLLRVARFSSLFVLLLPDANCLVSFLQRADLRLQLLQLLFVLSPCLSGFVLEPLVLNLHGL